MAVYNIHVQKLIYSYIKVSWKVIEYFIYNFKINGWEIRKININNATGKYKGRWINQKTYSNFEYENII